MFSKAPMNKIYKCIQTPWKRNRTIKATWITENSTGFLLEVFTYLFKSASLVSLSNVTAMFRSPNSINFKKFDFNALQFHSALFYSLKKDEVISPLSELIFPLCLSVLALGTTVLVQWADIERLCVRLQCADDGGNPSVDQDQAGSFPVCCVMLSAESLMVGER